MTTEISIWESGSHAAPKPPIAKGLPLLGNALEMKNDPLQFLVQQYAQLGPVFRVKALHQTFNVLAGPDANLFMSRHGDQYLSSREPWTKFADEIDSDYFLAMLSGDDHAQMRKVIKKPYSRHVLLQRLPETITKTRELLSTWPTQKPITVFPTMQRLLAEQIGYLTLNEGPGEYFDDFVIFMRTLLNAVLGQIPLFMLKMPSYRRAKARVLDLAQQMIDRHRQTDSSKREPDLIDYLLEASMEHPKLLSHPELLIGAIGPYLAGIDTAAGTLSFMLYALLKHPDVLARVKAEVNSHFAQGPLTAQSLRQMSILHAATQETLRMYPVSPMLPRTVAEPFTFAGYQLEAGDPIMMGIGVSHYDPNLYQNPYQFDPDRCLKPREEHKQPGALAPYGLGAHTCAGAGLAEVLIMVSAATIIHEWEMTMIPSDYDLKITLNPAPAPNSQFRIRVNHSA